MTTEMTTEHVHILYSTNTRTPYSFYGDLIGEGIFVKGARRGRLVRIYLTPDGDLVVTRRSWSGDRVGSDHEVCRTLFDVECWLAGDRKELHPEEAEAFKKADTFVVKFRRELGLKW
ncbi:MAG: hypothetical protein ABH877_04495 [bacterium]